MRPIVVTLPLRLVSEANAHTHWRKRQRRAKEQRHTVALAARAAIIEAVDFGRLGPACSLLPARIVVTRIAPRRLDVDNAWSSAKHTIDGIADAFGLPDNDERFEWLVEQRRGKSREYAVEIRIDRRTI